MNSLGGIKPRMEDIKEQDSETENNAATGQQKSNLQKKINEAVTKKYHLQTQLNRLKDSKTMLEMKNRAIGPTSSSGTQSKPQKSGFKMHHILAVSVLGLIAGAAT